jgi:hypothetical protein
MFPASRSADAAATAVLGKRWLVVVALQDASASSPCRSRHNNVQHSRQQAAESMHTCFLYVTYVRDMLYNKKGTVQAHRPAAAARACCRIAGPRVSDHTWLFLKPCVASFLLLLGTGLAALNSYKTNFIEAAGIAAC